MKNLLKYLATAHLVLFSILYASGQDFFMPNTGSVTYTSCTGTLYDYGGLGSNYPNNANQTLTICSGSALAVKLNIANYGIENNVDFLYIYDGANTSAPQLAALTGVGTNFSAVSSGSCLTLVFTSDAANNNTGFVAGISCVFPCQSFTTSLTGTTPAVQNGNEIEICEGDPVALSATANFLNNNVNYNQTIASTDFKWHFSDGTDLFGTNASRVFNDPGIYRVVLTAQDTNNCYQTSGNLELYIKVAGKPTFVGTKVLDNTICKDEVFGLEGQNQQVTSTFICQSNPTGTTFLNDGVGVPYSTTSTTDCFAPGSVVQSVNDIAAVCINMEHSWLGDLKISVACPNGSSVVLKPYPGGAGTFLGHPYDDPSALQGIGSTYCFSASATWPTMLDANTPAYWVNATNSAGNSMQPGTYKPEQAFTALIGCPLNGNWTLTVVDNLQADNGYIFDWNISFNPSLYNNPVPDFTPVTTNEQWTGNTITSQSNGDATASSAVEGNQCYTYTVTNNFDCSYDTTICVMVRPLPNAGNDTTVNVCPGETAFNLWTTLSGTQNISTTATWSGPSPLGGGHLGTFNPNVNSLGVYSVSILSQYGCGPDTANITVNLGTKPTVAYTGPSQICGNEIVLTAQGTVAAPSTIANYGWYVNNALVGSGSPFNYTSSLSPTTPLNGYVIVQSNFGCKDTVDFYTLMFAKPQANFQINDDCAGLTINPQNSSTFEGTPSSGSGLTYAWNFGDGNTSNQITPTHSYAQSGTYTVNLIAGSTESPCKDTLQATISVVPPIVPNFGYEMECFQTVTFFSLAEVDASDKIVGYDWSLGDGGAASDSTFEHKYTAQGGYDVVLTITNIDGCIVTGTQHVDIVESVELTSLEFPNIITPNGDGINDSFSIDEIYDDCYFYTFSLFSRWGALVFTTEVSSKELSTKSDLGSKLTDGVYFWTLVGRGKYTNSEEVVKNGTLTVLTSGTN